MKGYRTYAFYVSSIGTGVSGALRIPQAGKIIAVDWTAGIIPAAGGDTGYLWQLQINTAAAQGQLNDANGIISQFGLYIDFDTAASRTVASDNKCVSGIAFPVPAESNLYISTLQQNTIGLGVNLFCCIHFMY